MSRHVNTFTDGMVSDFDAQRQRPSTYTYARDCRVIFNKDGTLAIENSNGTRTAFSLPAGYTFIGACQLNSKLVIFSAIDAELPTWKSEIGVVREDVFGTYSYNTFFNDSTDIYGDKFYFNPKYPIEAHGVVETEKIERVFWGDDYNEDRVVNILAPLADITVHGTAEMCDLAWGLIKYVKNIRGNLTTGKRQYCYQYIHKSGYESPWSAPCDKIFITAEQINHFDWNQYQMGASGTRTSKGHQLEIKMLDTRFERIRVACILWETDAGPKEASIIYDAKIPNTGVVSIQHTENLGTPIGLEMLTQRYFEVQHSKTRLIKDSNYHKANVRFRTLLDFVAHNQFSAEDIPIRPLIKRMLSDEKKSQENSDLTSSAPLTNQQPKSTSIKRKLFNGWDEEYIIDSGDNAIQKGDYVNYKGTQWEHLFKGYWRGGTYGFAIVLWNRKGQPEFAFPIADFKFAEQYNNMSRRQTTQAITDEPFGSVGDYTLTEYSPGSTNEITDGSYGTKVIQGDNIVLKIMGAEFSDIVFPDSLLYDANGKLQISGFSIVRTDRISDILCQGLLINTIAEITGGQFILSTFTRTMPFDIPKVQPLHSTGNGYIDQRLNFGGKDYFTYADTGGGQRKREHGTNNSGGRWAVGRIFSFEAPDYIINPAIIAEQSNHYVKIIGNCQSADNGEHIVGLSGQHGHFFSKNYLTNMGGLYWFNHQISDSFNPFMSLGKTNFTGWGFEKQVNEMVKMSFEDAKSIDNGYYLISNKEAFLNSFYAPLSSTSIDFQARGHQNAIFLSTDIVNLSCRTGPAAISDPDTPTNNVCYFIVNYRTGLPDYQIDDNLLTSRIYQDIGHFVPINAQTLAAAANNGNGRRFEKVEVWGGDCYVDYFDYCRLLPLFNIPASGACDPPTKDYSIGLMFPLESNYNHPMRAGARYAKDGSMPEASVCGASVNTEQWRSGVFASRNDATLFKLEDFNVNRVFSFPDFKSLIDNNVSIRKYNPKWVGYVENKSFPLIEIVSDDKILGERFDNFRKFRINRFQYADGKHNSITKLEQLGQNIYVIQENGFSLLRFNQREMITTDSGAISTGTAQGYDKHDYISQYGSQHQWSVVNNGKSIYFVDAQQGKHLRFGQDGMNPLSDTYGQHDFFTKKSRLYWKRPQSTWDDNENFFDSPIYYGGIHSVYDYKNESVIVTFTAPKTKDLGKLKWIDTEPETIEYSEASNQYKQYHSFTPGLYFDFKMNYFSQNGNSVWVHDEGNKGQVYGAYTISRLKFVVNPGFPETKVYDNGYVNVNSGGESLFLRLTMRTEQQTQTITFATDSRVVYREDRLVFPLMQKSQTVRMRGEYLTLDYEFQNGNNQILRLSAQETAYRLSPKSPK